MSILFLTAAGAAPEAAAQFGLIPALKEGGPISIAIFSVMVIMSVFSFYIMFTKLFEQHKVLNQYKELRAQFWRAASLEEGAAKLDKNSAYRQVVDDGIAAQKQHGLLTDPGEAHDWVHNWPSLPCNGGRNCTVRWSARNRYRDLLGADQNRHRRSSRHRENRWSSRRSAYHDRNRSVRCCACRPCLQLASGS